MNLIGRKVYYDKATGNVIVDTGEMMGAVVETTIDQDFETYQALKERVRDTVGVIQLEYGQYAGDFAQCNGYRVNPETLELEFSYPDPNSTEPQEPVFVKPLTEQVKELEQRVKTPLEIYNETDKTQITLDELKQLRINLLKEECSQAIYNGFLSESTGYYFGFNQLDQINFTQQMLLIVADTNNEITTIQWKTKNAGVVTLTKEQFLQVAEEAKQHKLTQQQKYWNLEQQILAATTKEEIENITW
jgi:hypothetical protein